MRPEQRKEQLVILPPQPFDGQALAADGQISAEYPELDALPGDARSDLSGTAEQLGRGLDRLLTDHGNGTWLNDAGLVGGDFGDRVAEELSVIDRDRRDHRHDAVGHVGVVPRAA